MAFCLDVQKGKLALPFCFCVNIPASSLTEGKMTKTEIAQCRTGICKYIADASSADFIQELANRLKSASSVIESSMQECVSIFDEMENIVNDSLIAEGKNPISVQFSPKVEEDLQLASSLADVLDSSLAEGSETLRNSGIAWYAEEEPVEALVEGEKIRCWHMGNDGETATICLEYLGGPRMEVPLSSLSHIEE